MKIFKMIIFCCLLNLMTIAVFSQNAVMIHSGEIEFEKRVNAFAILDEYYIGDVDAGQSEAESRKQFAQQYKANNQQFGITNFNLSFNDEYSLYTPTQSTIDNSRFILLTTKNTVYSDLKNGTSIAKKKAFGDVFLISNSVRKIQWKITNEIKEIAGFSCRRANAIIMDSIYVVAFYTDQIVPKTGPESFTGLPGMILGVALPHEHITWMATHVYAKQILNEQIKPPVEGKKVNNNQLMQILINNPSISANKKTGYLFLRNYLF